jgi:hypothetical protein
MLVIGELVLLATSTTVPSLNFNNPDDEDDDGSNTWANAECAPALMECITSTPSPWEMRSSNS